MPYKHVGVRLVVLGSSSWWLGTPPVDSRSRPPRFSRARGPRPSSKSARRDADGLRDGEGRRRDVVAGLEPPHGHVELGLERAREAVRVALCFNKLHLRIPGRPARRRRSGPRKTSRDFKSDSSLPTFLSQPRGFQRSNQLAIATRALRRRVHDAARARGEPLLVDVALPR